MPSMPEIKGFVPMSLCDWPGRTSCVMFLGGCDFRCPTCHNAGLAFAASSLPSLDQGRLLARIAAVSGWLDGVVVSGGEPTIHRELPTLLRAIKQATGLPIKVDSNGMHPEICRAILRESLADVLAIDVKGAWGDYPTLTGGRATQAEAEAKLSDIFTLALEVGPGRIYFRHTMVPGVEKGFAPETVIPPGFECRRQAYVPPMTGDYNGTGTCAYA